MECEIFKKFLQENDCDRGNDILPIEIKNHIHDCACCKKYYQLTLLLNSQKGLLEKAPETLLPSVQQRILERQKRREHVSLHDIFRVLAKPAIGFAVLFIMAALYVHLKNSPIGVVDNLADRFNISELKDIKSDDVLYVAKQINVDLTLNGKVKLDLDSNTVLQLRAKDKISLFRGELYVAAGNDAMKIETPNGLITVKNAKTKIQITIHDENGKQRAKTSCSVIDGSIEVGNLKEKVSVTRGLEIVLAENGKIESRNSLPDAALKEQTFRINSPSKSKVFTAKEQLCNCLYDIRYELDNNQLHGKEMKENKFPVRIFWRNKDKIESMRRLDETVCFFNAGGGCTLYNGNGPGI